MIEARLLVRDGDVGNYPHCTPNILAISVTIIITVPDSSTPELKPRS